ncbi:MAG: response regulator [Prolixibacteraceae bacterium]|jgi:signal transduction histidine kinase/ligand-binding sensor domain-containing protein/DNA-binding NarL/FixJ family response regulator|nr:response regulator [Prolixibacteraceae bacterium]
MKKFILLCLLLKVFNAFPMDGYDFRWLDVKTGLTDNTVNSICRDSYGFMWFATDNGLSRYDGFNYKHYFTVPIGTYNNKINHINEDAEGNIWIHATDKILLYNRDKDILDNNIKSKLNWLNVAGDVEQLFVDHNRNLWCVIDSTLFYYNYKSKQKSIFPLPKNEHIKWMECRDGNAFILFDSGLLGKVNFSTNSINKELTIELSSSFHHKIYIDDSYNIWFYTAYSPDNILRRYNPQTKTWKILTDKTKHICDFITSIIDVGNGDIWIGTVEAGVSIYHTKTDSFTNLTYKKDNPFSLSTNHINCFYKDKQDIVWVGTSKRGIAYTSLNNILFERDKLADLNDVSCIIEDKIGNLWLGSDGEGLVCVDKSTKKSIRYSAKNRDIPSDLIICTFLDSKNRIWFGTYGGGAFYHDKNNFVNLNIENQQIAGLLKDIRSIEEDAAGNIWLGTIDKGLFCYDTNGNIEHYNIDNTALPTNSITDLHCNFDQSLYIATSSGLCVMNTQTLMLSVLKSNNKGTQQFPNKLINCIYRDSRNRLWIGEQRGLHVFDSVLDSIFHLTTENGISHNYIRGIAEDQNNNIWITTNFGITNIVVVNDPARAPIFRYYRYFDQDGIGNIAFNLHSIFCNRKGEILMGGMGGYIKTAPTPIQYKQSNSKVIFTALKISNNQIEVGEAIGNNRIILPKNIQLAREITLDYSDNNFSIDVSSMNYESPHKTKFAYRLSDDANWIKLAGNTIYFNKLPAGVYNLQVKASNNGGNWINEPSNLIIRVNPPFWKSTRAYILYLLVFFISNAVLIIRTQKKIKLKMQMQKLELNVAKQQEINEEKMRFFTNISHDLRTPLSLIITPLEKILEVGIPDKSIKEDLERIHRNAVFMVDEVNQLLDLRKLDNGDNVPNLSHGDLPVFVKEVCNTFDYHSNKKGIRLEVILKSSSIQMDFDRNKIQRIVMNLLSNAFKYNIENGRVVVTVGRVLGAEGELARIQVADTGIGILDKNKTKIFERFNQEDHDSVYIGNGIGLHIVQEYVLLHGGKVEVKDNIHQGSVFIVTLPISTTLQKLEPEEVQIDEQTMEEIDAELPILVVEDNDDFRQFIINFLKEHYPVIAAPHGQNALNIMAKQSVQMVISDIMMPVMDGLELCNRIKQDIRFSHIPVILLTARTGNEHILKGLQEGADDYITKPFNLDILLLRINKIIEWGKNSHKKFKVAEIEPSEITISSLDEQLISKAIALVEENMSDPDYSVEKISTALGMSRGHFYKKLIAITGRTPIEFIRTLRIKRGRQFIEKSQLNISEIADKVGLSPKQFAKYFKEMYGELPSSYNNNKQKFRISI